MTRDPQLRATYEECVDQYADSMYRVAFRLLGNPDQARELVQETYLQAWQNLDRLRGKNQLKSWMFSILRNQYTKQLRKLSKVSQLESPDRIPTVQANTTDTSELIQSAINQLGDKHKLPVLLVSMEGLTVEQAAEVLEVPKGTILSRLHRARKELKTILERMKIHESY
jgi:RNA polymerase sigma-70 factor (ECF subfamily)